MLRTDKKKVKSIHQWMEKSKDEIYKNRYYYIFVVPLVLYLIIFRYTPLYFVQIAFRDYRITKSVAESTWVGFDNFKKLFISPGFLTALFNTFIISFYKLLIGFPAPIILALFLNEIESLKFKKVAQTIIYLPHFISWSIIGGIMYNLLSVESGIVNHMIQAFGSQPIFFMGDTKYFRSVLILSEVWKEMGWGTILYLSAIANIDPSIYEAAFVDGANRLQKLFYITLPSIKTTITVLLIIRVGNILNVGFEQILVLSNPMVQSVADVLDTYVYRVGLQEGRYSLAAAAGLFKTLVAAVLVFSSDRIAKKLGEDGLF